MTLKTSITVAVVSVLAATVSVLVASPAAAVVRDSAAGGAATVSRATDPYRDGPVPARPDRPAPTRTTLTVTPTSGPAHQPVTLTVVVTSGTRVSSGTVTIRDGSTILVGGLALDRGAASITTNALGPGEHVLTAEFAGTTKAAGSTSDPVGASYGDAGGGGAATFNVVLTIPMGSLSITTPYTVDRPLDLGAADLDQSTSTFAAGVRIDDIAITDTRAGNLGFAASVSSSRFVNSNGDSFAAARAGFVDVAADQVPGNAMLARDVRVVEAPPGTPGLGPSRVFASYPAGISLGTVRLHGRLVVKGVPSSVHAGRYRATLTFTAL
jgi:Bacterial Ig-like domain (group 3)